MKKILLGLAIVVAAGSMYFILTDGPGGTLLAPSSGPSASRTAPSTPMPDALTGSPPDSLRPVSGPEQAKELYSSADDEGLIAQNRTAFNVGDPGLQPDDPPGSAGNDEEVRDVGSARGDPLDPVRVDNDDLVRDVGAPGVDPLAEEH